MTPLKRPAKITTPINIEQRHPMTSIIPISAFTDNYIWTLLDETTQTAWVVDPGDAAPVIAKLQKNHYTLKGILITHHHSDHTGGIEALLRVWPGTPVYGSMKSPIKHITHRLKENDDIICGSISLRVLEIPGHTLDHIAYVNNDLLFSGDALFSAGCGKVFEGTPAQMYQSLMKLNNLPDKTQLFCGHEYTLANLHFAQLVEPNNPDIADKIQQNTELRQQNLPTLPSTLREERLINPFLRCSISTVIGAVEKQVNQPLTDPVDVFTHLRAWKTGHQ